MRSIIIEQAFIDRLNYGDDAVFFAKETLHRGAVLSIKHSIFSTDKITCSVICVTDGTVFDKPPGWMAYTLRKLVYPEPGAATQQHDTNSSQKETRFLLGQQ